MKNRLISIALYMSLLTVPLPTSANIILNNKTGARLTIQTSTGNLTLQAGNNRLENIGETFEKAYVEAYIGAPTPLALQQCWNKCNSDYSDCVRDCGQFKICQSNCYRISQDCRHSACKIWSKNNESIKELLADAEKHTDAFIAARFDVTLENDSVVFTPTYIPNAQ